MVGFEYPAPKLARRHGPRGYASHRSYRPWLRDEFAFRCVYCLVREQWGRVSGDFDLDHFVPQSLDGRTTSEYDNLLYSCAACNLGKEVQLIPNPTAALTSEQVRIHEDGAIEGLTPETVRLIRMLDLDGDDYRRWRRMWLRILELAHRYDLDLFQELMGYPDDLPDLSRYRPPDGNVRPEGIDESYHTLRALGELPNTY